MYAGNRPINYLRISVTDRCNFRCQYCSPCQPDHEISHDKIARYEEILKIVHLACDLGITKVRITGGEPFVRKGIFDFLEQLSRNKSLKDISVTTNGALLDSDKIERLVNMGIKRLNFSLDTLDPETFIQITGKNDFQATWNAIKAAHNTGMKPIKLNTVLLKGINDNTIKDMAGLIFDYPFHIRFIEYMPMGNESFKPDEFILTDQVKQIISDSLGKLCPLQTDINDGPAKKFTIEGAKGIIGFITPVSSHFCTDCNRLRLTARGTLRPCLLNNFEKDILGPLRNKATDEKLKQIILSTLKKKPATHDLSKRTAKDIPISHMTSIGG